MLAGVQRYTLSLSPIASGPLLLQSSRFRQQSSLISGASRTFSGESRIFFLTCFLTTTSFFFVRNCLTVDMQKTCVRGLMFSSSTICSARISFDRNLSQGLTQSSAIMGSQRRLVTNLVLDLGGMKRSIWDFLLLMQSYIFVKLQSRCAGFRLNIVIRISWTSIKSGKNGESNEMDDRGKLWRSEWSVLKDVVSKDNQNQNRSIRLSPDVASPLFSIVLGVSNRLFSETVSLVLVFFFFCVIDGVISCKGDLAQTLLIFSGVLRQLAGIQFSLSSKIGENGVDTSSLSIFASKSQILLPMMSKTSSFYSDSSFYFSIMRLKLSLYSMKSSSGLELSCLGAYKNSATWMGELNNLS